MGKSIIQNKGTVSPSKRCKPIEIITEDDYKKTLQSVFDQDCTVKPIYIKKNNGGSARKIDKIILIQMLQQGKTQKEIANFFDVSPSSVKDTIQRLRRDGIIAFY